MKRIYYVLFAVIIVLISIECRKELSVENAFPGQGNIQSSPISATLQGNIINENDQPAEGVVITVGAKTATTNSRGYFRIVDAPLDKHASLVTAEQPGYFTAYRTFSATSGVNQVVIKLIKKTLAGTIDAATGGSVALANGSKISLVANGVTATNGAAYTGNINVYASYIDPASNDIGKKVPGSFMGDDKNDKRVVLSSFGMLAVNLESSAGETQKKSDSNFVKTYMQSLFEIQYQWKRFSAGARYSFGLQPYLEFTLPGGIQREEKNSSLQIFIRYEIGQSRRKE